MQRIDEPIAEAREAICRIARSWIGTSYHHTGRVKGAGVDCAMFPLEVYREAGMIGDVVLPYYPADWMLHRSEEVFLYIVQRYATEIKAPPATLTPSSAKEAVDGDPVAGGSALPGDFVIYRFGRCFAHGAIVLEWPTIIHALTGRGVVLADGEREGCLVRRPKRFFTLFPVPSEKLTNSSTHENASAM
jgi:cell wall-associated NlpC family hydrolase